MSIHCSFTTQVELNVSFNIFINNIRYPLLIEVCSNKIIESFKITIQEGRWVIQSMYISNICVLGETINFIFFINRFPTNIQRFIFPEKPKPTASFPINLRDKKKKIYFLFVAKSDLSVMWWLLAALKVVITANYPSHHLSICNFLRLTSWVNTLQYLQFSISYFLLKIPNLAPSNEKFNRYPDFQIKKKMPNLLSN